MKCNPKSNNESIESKRVCTCLSTVIMRRLNWFCGYDLPRGDNESTTSMQDQFNLLNLSVPLSHIRTSHILQPRIRCHKINVKNKIIDRNVKTVSIVLLSFGRIEFVFFSSLGFCFHSFYCPIYDVSQ